jgi:lipid-A-disaccharide synthase
MKSLKIFIIAGEVSGDVLGEKIMRALPRDTRFIGIGGQHMQKVGLRPIFPISDLAVMGLFEVLAHAKTLTRRINETADAILKFQPDIVLTIDSPGFAKRVVKKVRGRINTKFYHVVAPQVWAWGEKRAKKFAQIFDKLYAFFDFEKPYFEKYGLPVVAVGHPIADGLHPSKKSNHQSAKSKEIALIPGSRMSEVKKMLPLMRATAEKMCHQKSDVWYNFYIPVVETTFEYIKKETADWCTKPELIPSEKRYELYKKTDIAIAASGTISAELAIMHIPAIIVYKMNPLTEFLAHMLLKIKWASLVNILMNKTIYPELLGGKATPENIIHEIHNLENPSIRKKMIEQLSQADKMWHRTRPAAELIAKDIIGK